jgi:epoxyqueuosine reductase QueG
MERRSKKDLERTKQMERFARKTGADLFGVANAEILAKAPEGFRPQDILPDCKAVIMVGKRLSDATVETTPSRMFDTMYFAVNGFLDRLLIQVVDFLTSAGFKGVAVGPHSLDGKLLMGDLSQKHAAVAAGLGKFGLQSLVLTPQFGPRQRWGAVVTNAPLKPGTPLKEDLCRPEKCGYACIENCPAKVFSERSPEGIADRNFLPGGLWYYWNIDKKGCREYRAQKKKELGWVTEGGHACAVCLKVCPVGKRTK